MFIIITASAILGAMLYFTGLIPMIGQWYSFDQSFRLQTDAFLEGGLAINPVPYGHRYDWAWGNGIHQVWGLGVPIIRLPFEILGKIFGSFGFPDRIVFVIFYFFVTAIFWKSLDSTVTPEPGIKNRLRKRLQNIPALILVMLNPAFITMIRAKFEPYDEVVAYSYLWAIMLFALILLLLNNSKGWLFFLICFLAGFSPNIRPTAISYGIGTFLIASYLAMHNRIRFRWLGLIFFSGGIVFLLITNYLRFNSPFEFGHKLILSGSSIQDYMMKFSNPVAQMPFLSAASGLFSDLFFTDLNTSHLIDDRLLSGSDFPRIREFYFRPYDLVTPFLLFLSWFIAAVVRRKSGFLSHLDIKPIQIAGLWSLCSFIILFYFYMRFPVLSSRYFVDFGASIVIGIAALYLYVGNLSQYRFQNNISLMLNLILGAAFLGWSLFGLTHANINYRVWHRSQIRDMNPITAEAAQKNVAQMRRATGPLLPWEYRCKDQETKFDIPFNNQGWDISNSCAVSLTTTHFFDTPQCIAVNIEAISGVPEWMAKMSSDEEIEVRTGIKAMQRISDVKSGYGKIITFCSGRKNIENNKDRQIELISIKWSDLRKHPNLSTPPLRLISLSKVDKPIGN